MIKGSINQEDKTIIKNLHAPNNETQEIHETKTARIDVRNIQFNSNSWGLNSRFQ